jgi:hypothetical protein
VAESLSANGREMNLTMAMDVYAKGASPFGVLSGGGGGNSLVVFRGRKCQIEHMFCPSRARPAKSLRATLVRASSATGL